MEFIMVPVVLWICVSGTYSLFELYARRKERLLLIEKCGDKLDNMTFNGKIGLPNYMRTSFSSLKIGCLLIGLGLGILVGLMITTELLSDGYDYWKNRELFGAAYGAPVLLFGGAGLLVSFLIENGISKKSPDHKQSDLEV
ncbi:MAG: hypothetical protein LBT78_04120 [Tannerella sp.]|nr:hypothetical protein [Tannerella sp.]